MAKIQRSRGVGHYAKPALTHEQLVQRLNERGLGVPDPARATRYLRHLGYYRLSPYTIPFQIPGAEHSFRPGVVFDDVLDLYVFDRALRLLVLDALERVEVAVRSALTDHMSVTYDGPHWYVDASHFQQAVMHSRFLKGVRENCDEQLRRAAESNGDHLVFRSALEHYLTTYGYPELPPSWLMVETLTIGALERLIRNLKRRSDKTAIASMLGINAALLDSWLRTYVRVRNVCAHHGRLWNVGLGVYPALPASRAISWLDDELVLKSWRRKRLYPVLVSLQSILNTISPRSTWAQRLSDLLQEHPHLPLRGMGVPEDWREDSFWAAHLTRPWTTNLPATGDQLPDIRAKRFLAGRAWSGCVPEATVPATTLQGKSGTAGAGRVSWLRPSTGHSAAGPPRVWSRFEHRQHLATRNVDNNWTVLYLHVTGGAETTPHPQARKHASDLGIWG